MIEQLNGNTETVRFVRSNAVRLYHNREVEDFPLHWHLPGELICPIHNGYQVTVAGERLTLEPRDILIIASGELHSIQAPADGDRYILNFNTDLFGQFQDLSLVFAEIHPFCLLRHRNTPEITDQLFEVLQKMEEEYLSPNLYRDCEVSSQMLHFFTIAGRFLQKQTTLLSLDDKQRTNWERIIALCSYINQHCAEDLKLEDLADVAGFSKYHFSRLFKEMTGVSCHDYLLQRRIHYAKYLLADVSLSITDVAMRSGFNSLATFNRIFITQIGCTPSDFRKLSRNSA